MATKTDDDTTPAPVDRQNAVPEQADPPVHERTSVIDEEKLKGQSPAVQALADLHGRIGGASIPTWEIQRDLQRILAELGVAEALPEVEQVDRVEALMPYNRPPEVLNAEGRVIEGGKPTTEPRK
jgi:hypothetical protein